MSRYTTAYSSFRLRLGEVDILQRLATAKEREAPLARASEIDALCRGAVVLLCSHLEAFIKELGEVALDALHTKKVRRTNIDPALFYHISKDILDEIADTTEPRRIAGKVFSFVSRDLPYWSRSGPFPQPIHEESFNKGFSNPAFDKIRAYFNRFGYFDYKSDLAKLLQANYAATANMVDHLVDTRNKIAHGDRAATKTPQEIQQMGAMILRYCSATDSVFATWCRKTLCGIR